MSVALKPQINDRTALDVDRSGCPADRHGTHWYRKHGCTCPDAVAAKARYEKFYRAGVLPSGTVPVVGTARRLQAFAVNGWGCTALAERWGCDYSQLHRWRTAGRPTIHRLNAEFVARNYDAMRDIHGGDVRAMWLAKRRDWLSPAQLATFDIDDPVAGPLVRPFVPVGRIHLDEVDRMRKYGMSDARIAEALGIKECSIRSAELRSRKGAA